MRPAIEADIQGIKCDAVGCDYKDDAINCADYADWVDRPCPECGANLLTQADYDLVQQLLQITEVLNTAVDGSDVEPYAQMKVEMDGSGIPTLKELGIENGS